MRNNAAPTRGRPKGGQSPIKSILCVVCGGLFKGKGRAKWCPPCRKTVHAKWNKKYYATLSPEKKLLNQQKSTKWDKEHFFQRRANYIKQQHPGEETASPQELWSMWKAQRGRCALTGVLLRGQEVHIDHKLAKVRSGTGHAHNLRFVTGPANRAKHTLDDAVFYAMCSCAVEKRKKDTE